MKWVILPALLLFLSPVSQGQTAKALPRLTMIEGGLSNKFELGGSRQPKSAIKLHLKTNENATGQAFVFWKKADTQSTASVLWMAALIGGGGLMVASIVKGYKANEAPVVAGAGIVLLSATCSLATGFSSQKNYRKSVEAYNKAAGY